MRADSRRILGPDLETRLRSSDSTGGSHDGAAGAGWMDAGAGAGVGGSGAGAGAAVFGLEGTEVVAKPRAGFEGCFFFLPAMMREEAVVSGREIERGAGKEGVLLEPLES
jgi:hypothetical protein